MMQYGVPITVNAMRVHVTRLGPMSLRISYHKNNPADPHAVPTGDPVFFEDVHFTEGKDTWVSQLVVGDMATVHGSGYFIDIDGKRHFVMQVEPGHYDMLGKALETGEVDPLEDCCD